jgi:hypothetical protein
MKFGTAFAFYPAGGFLIPACLLDQNFDLSQAQNNQYYSVLENHHSG